MSKDGECPYCREQQPLRFCECLEELACAECCEEFESKQAYDLYLLEKSLEED